MNMNFDHFYLFLRLIFLKHFLNYFKGVNQNPRKSCDWKNELLVCDCSESENCDQAWISFFFKNFWIWFLLYFFSFLQKYRCWNLRMSLFWGKSLIFFRFWYSLQILDVLILYWAWSLSWHFQGREPI